MGKHREYRKFVRLAWLPIPLLTAAIVAARVAGLRGFYENESLRLVLSFGFYTLASLGTLFLIGRSFLRSGAPGLLLLACGVVFWSLAGTIGDLVAHGDANINVTIFNTSILLAGLCHLAGAVLSLRPGRALRLRGVWLGLGCAAALAALGIITWATFGGGFPVFFIPGQGGTAVRYCVLVSATAMFLLAAVVLLAGWREQRPPFAYWYSLALLLLAVGLLGITIQLSLWSVVNWLARAAQWLGGLYLLFAAVAALRESELPLFAPPDRTGSGRYRYGVAVAVVLAAAALRLAFLPALGIHAPFVTFYPAVMLAALYGGQRAGWLATALSGVLAHYFWMEPRGRLAVRDPGDWLGLGIFLLSGWMISWVSEAMHQARDRAAAAEAEARLAAERQRAAEALRESEAKAKAWADELAALMDTVPAITFIAHDPECRRLTSNRATRELLRLPQGANASKSAPGTERPGSFRAMRDGRELRPEELPVQLAASSGGAVRDAELRVVFEDGTSRDIAGNAVPLFDAEGRVRGAVGAFMDITDRKRAEDALRESEERYRTLFTSISEAFVLKEAIRDQEGRIIDFRFLETNPAFETHSGLCNVVGKTMLEVMPDIEPVWIEKYASVVTTGAALRFEQRAAELDRWFDVFASRAEGSGSGRVAILFNDITERKRAQETVRESEQRLKLAQQAGRIGSFEWNVRTGVNVWSPELEAMYGLEPGEFGKTQPAWEQLVHPDDRAAAVESVKRAFETGEPVEAEWRVTWPDGSIHWITGRFQAFRDAAGQPLRLNGVNIDITDRKKAQAVLARDKEELEKLVAERTERLQEMVGELEHFSYTITHDMRAPLRGMRGFGELLLDWCAGCEHRERPEFIGRIMTSAGRMDALITDALNYSKAVRQELPLENVDTGALLRGMLDTYPELQASRTDIRVEGELPVVLGNQAGLTQCFSNLLGNALKFVQPGQRPQIRVWAEVVDSAKLIRDRPASQPPADSQPSTLNHQRVRIWVEDKGIGISKEMLPRVFDMFSRGSKSHEGTGIGLALVRKVAQRMGGRAGVESNEGKGSRFWLELRGPEVGGKAKG